MKKALAVVLILSLTGCATLLKITEGIQSFLDVVDSKAEIYCELGYIPQPACEKYQDLKAKAIDAWSANKDKLLDWVIEFILRNAAARGGADVSAEEAARDILNSAKAHLPYVDYMRLKDATQ